MRGMNVKNLLLGAAVVLIGAYGCVSYELAPIGKNVGDLVTNPSEVVSAWLAQTGSLFLGIIFLLAVAVAWYLLSEVYDRWRTR